MLQSTVFSFSVLTDDDNINIVMPKKLMTIIIIDVLYYNIMRPTYNYLVLMPGKLLQSTTLANRSNSSLLNLNTSNPLSQLS